jgi:Uma2 family endonuclease
MVQAIPNASAQALQQVSAPKAPAQKSPARRSLSDYLNGDADSNQPCELAHGELVEMPPPTWLHILIAKFLEQTFDAEIDRLGQPWVALRETGQQTNDNSARRPDVSVVPLAAIEDYNASALLTVAAPLVVEIVSDNWRDDYLTKQAEYETLGIPEFWLVDYLGLGGRRFIGTPKQPTLSIYQWVDGEYQVQLFRAGDRIASGLFPNLTMTAGEIFNAGRTITGL